MNAKVCFVPSGPIHWASSRFRAYWPAKYMADAVVVPWQDNNLTLPYADNYVWFKRTNLEFLKVARDNGANHFWDVCDPVWWFSPDVCQGMNEMMDGVVCATDALRQEYHEWAGPDMPTTVIGDRFELSHYNKRREHHNAKPVRFLWYGMAVNRGTLVGAWAALARLAANGYNISLTIMDDAPGQGINYGDEFPVYHIKWRLQQEIEVMCQHDIVLVPPYPGPWGKLKSDNKANQARLCGLPAVTGFDYDELEALLNVEHRQQQATWDREWALKNCDVQDSAKEWEAFLWG